MVDNTGVVNNGGGRGSMYPSGGQDTDKEWKSPFDVADGIKRKRSNPGMTGHAEHHYGNKGSGSSSNTDDSLEKVMGAGVYVVKNGGDPIKNRQPMTKTAKNPMLEGPTVMGQRFFGQLPIFKKAMDAVLAKLIATFPKESNGGGASAFGLGNSSAFGQPMQLIEAVANVMTGGSSSLAGSDYIPSILQQAQNVASMAGAQMHTLIDLTRPDHMIPFMNAMSSSLSGSADPHVFSNDVFQEAVQLASAVQQHLVYLSGGQASYNAILDNIANGGIEQAIAALSVVNGTDFVTTYNDLSLQATVTQVIRAANLLLQHPIPTIDDIHQAIGVLQQVSGSIASFSSSLQPVIDNLGQLTQLPQTLSDLHSTVGSIADIANSVGNFQISNLPSNLVSAVPGLGQLQSLTGQLQGLSGSLSQLSSLSGVVGQLQGALGSFGNLSQLSNLASLPTALSGAMNSLGMNPQQMMSQLTQLTANEQKQIIGHIVKEKGQF